MSLIPIVLRGCWDVPLRMSRILEHQLTRGPMVDDFLTAWTMATVNHRPWRNPILTAQEDVPSVDGQFQITVNVQKFRPEEITVKSVDKEIIIEGKHEEKQDDHGFVSRHFVRRYTIPHGHDVSQIASSLSTDGILTITAPKLLEEQPNQRTIPVMQTGRPAAAATKETPKESTVQENSET